MKHSRQSPELIKLASNALTAMLRQVSGVRIEEMRQGPEIRDGFLARINVFGHSHFLSCAVNPGRQLEQLQSLLNDSRGAFPDPADATRLVIAPRLSPQAQDLCKKHLVGFLDLEGNARLSVGELFICMRSLPANHAENSTAVSSRPHARTAAHSGARESIWKLPHQPKGAALPA